MIRVGIDIGGTKVNIGLLEESGKVLAKENFPVGNASDMQVFIPKLHDAIKRLAQEAGVEGSEIGFCGIGVPGTVSADKLTVGCAPNLGWIDLPLGKEFQEYTGYKVKLVQDAKAAAWAEYCAGAGKGQDLICVTLGTGIGTGLVLDGKIYEGALGTAGELGHVPVKLNGRPCACGKVGCMECYSAGKGLGFTAKELYGEDADARTLFAKAAEGDKAASDAIEEAIVFLGTTFVAAVNLMSPACLLVSGGLSERKTEYAEPFMKFVKEHAYEIPGRPLEVKFAALGSDAPMIGAALLPAD